MKIISVIDNSLSIADTMNINLYELTACLIAFAKENMKNLLKFVPRHIIILPEYLKYIVAEYCDNLLSAMFILFCINFQFILY